ncbi:hypothetical protein ONJ87_26355, partial [Salmonella enterica subsp. enterica serovar Anatum]|nr:hypothetical protein [Salmonella enterica subsp. enterica serovar Anatum]
MSVKQLWRWQGVNDKGQLEQDVVWADNRLALIIQDITGKPPRQPQGHFVKLFLPAPGKFLHGSTHQVNRGRILRE